MAFYRRPNLESLEGRWSPATLAQLPCWTTAVNPASGAVALTVTAEPTNHAVAIHWEGGMAEPLATFHLHPTTQALQDKAWKDLAAEHATGVSHLVTDCVFTR